MTPGTVSTFSPNISYNFRETEDRFREQLVESPPPAQDNYLWLDGIGARLHEPQVRIVARCEMARPPRPMLVP